MLRTIVDTGSVALDWLRIDALSALIKIYGIHKVMYKFELAIPNAMSAMLSIAE